MPNGDEWARRFPLPHEVPHVADDLRNLARQTQELRERCDRLEERIAELERAR